MATRSYPDGSSRSRSRVPAASAPRRSRHAARTGRPGRSVGPDDVYVAGATSGARRRTTAPCPRTIGPGAISPSRRSFRPESGGRGVRIGIAFGGNSCPSPTPVAFSPSSPTPREGGHHQNCTERNAVHQSTRSSDCAKFHQKDRCASDRPCRHRVLGRPLACPYPRIPHHVPCPSP
jgi:hypothetical protein